MKTDKPTAEREKPDGKIAQLSNGAYGVVQGGVDVLLKAETSGAAWESLRQASCFLSGPRDGYEVGSVTDGQPFIVAARPLTHEVLADGIAYLQGGLRTPTAESRANDKKPLPACRRKKKRAVA